MDAIVSNIRLELIRGNVVDVTKYPVLNVNCITIPGIVLQLDHELFSNTIMYTNGIYLKYQKVPIINRYKVYMAKNELSNKYYRNYVDTTPMYTRIDKISDLERVFKTYNRIYDPDTFDLVLDIADYNRIKSNLVDSCTYPIILEEILQHALVTFMYNDHIEHNLIDRDILNISNHICLYDKYYLQYNSYKDLVKDLIVDNTGVYAIDVDKLNMYYKHVDMLIKSMVDVFCANPFNSYRISMYGNLLAIEHTISPSTRRYYLNKMIINTIGDTND